MHSRNVVCGMHPRLLTHKLLVAGVHHHSSVFIVLQDRAQNNHVAHETAIFVRTDEISATFSMVSLVDLPLCVTKQELS